MQHFEQHFELHFEPEYWVLYQEPNGMWLKRQWQEIACAPLIKRIQYNTQSLQNYIIVDIDNSDIYKYREAKLPEPNFIIKNKHKVGAHLFWVLNRTVNTEGYKQLWKDIFKNFSVLAGGDQQAMGFIGKNLNNNIDFNIEFIEPVAYNIHSLTSYLAPTISEKLLSISTTSKKTNKKQKIETKKKRKGEARNRETFDTVRVMAYKEIRRSVNNNDFMTLISNYAHKHNREYDSPLDIKELQTIIDSIVNWCIKHRTKIKNDKNLGIMNLDINLELKVKQKLSAERTNKVKSNKVQTKIQIAIIEMRKQDMKINVSSVAEYTTLSRPTITKYNFFLNEKV